MGFNESKLVDLIEQGPGTSFDKKVWKSIALIPRGQTKTYGQIARELGSPRAARAVANACGRNPYAPRVPCHRVVGSQGRLGGYSGVGGVLRKKKLLQEEGVSLK